MLVIIINHQMYAARASNQSTNPKAGGAGGAWQKEVKWGICMSLGMADLLWFGRADLVCGSERQGFFGDFKDAAAAGFLSLHTRPKVAPSRRRARLDID